MSLSRRDLLRTTAAGLAAAPLVSSLGGTARGADAAAEPRFLIVLSCSGGASMIDSFLAQTESEVKAAGGDAAGLNCYPDALVRRVDGSPFRAVNQSLEIGI